MVDYVSFQNLAERLIEANGRDLSLVRRDQVNLTDPTKPWRGSTEVDTITVVVKGVFIDFEKEDFDGSLVRRGDKRVLIAAKSVTDEGGNASNLKIEDYDHILDAGVRWKIITVETIEPGPLRIMFDIQVRQ
jgi:hypothetical protein